MKRLFCLICAIMLMMPAAGFTQEAPNEDAPEVVVSEARTLAYGDKGDDVLQLQTRLKKKLYYAGPLSGNYMEVTRKAVRAVQAAYGLEVTGKADAATQEIIYGELYRPLEKGSSGEDVKQLQTRLSELGYYWGKISGNYLDGTTAAIGNFQIDNGIERTGKADVATQQRLYSDDIAMPSPDPGATPPPPGPATPEPDTTFPGKLVYGSKGKGVELLQQQLKTLGFFDAKVKITGGFYRHTQAAVKSFQTYNGIVSDGVVDEATWNALFEPDVVHASATPRPSPAPTPVPYAVEVDVNNQLIKVFGRDEQNELNKLEKVFWCSTGTTSYPSKVGVHVLTGRKASSALFPNWGNATARWWTRITSDIAFHSILFNSSGAVSMKSVNRLGKRASHGCIRLSMADAKWVYDHIGKGVEVTIHEEAAADPELKYAHKPGPFNKKTYYHEPTPAPTQQPNYSPALMPDTIRELKVGSEGEDVFWLQSRLKELGFYQGTITGQYREGTQAAVKAYQKANKLSQNGCADKKTLEHLYEATREEFFELIPLPTDVPEPLPTATPQPDSGQ